MYVRQRSGGSFWKREGLFLWVLLVGLERGGREEGKEGVALEVLLMSYFSKGLSEREREAIRYTVWMIIVLGKKLKHDSSAKLRECVVAQITGT